MVPRSSAVTIPNQPPTLLRGYSDQRIRSYDRCDGAFRRPTHGLSPSSARGIVRQLGIQTYTAEGPSFHNLYYDDQRSADVRKGTRGGRSGLPLPGPMIFETPIVIGNIIDSDSDSPATVTCHVPLWERYPLPVE